MSSDRVAVGVAYRRVVHEFLEWLVTVMSRAKARID